MLAEHAGADAAFEPGDLVEFTAPNGARYSGVLKQIDPEWALFDFNHPLAGTTSRVDVHILVVLSWFVRSPPPMPGTCWPSRSASVPESTGPPTSSSEPLATPSVPTRIGLSVRVDADVRPTSK